MNLIIFLYFIISIQSVFIPMKLKESYEDEEVTRAFGKRESWIKKNNLTLFNETVPFLSPFHFRNSHVKRDKIIEIEEEEIISREDFH